jgi:hypothetical protein
MDETGPSRSKCPETPQPQLCPAFRGQKKTPPRRKQLHIISLRWRTIEFEIKQDMKGGQLEDAFTRYISKK